jgi:hypothetical protein
MAASWRARASLARGPRLSLAALCAALLVHDATAQQPPGTDAAASGAAAAAPAKPQEEQKPKTVAEVLKDSDRIDGLFTLYRDRKTGDLRLLLRQDQLDKPHLYFTYTENGVPAAGQFRGAFLTNQAKVFRFSRYFDRVELVVENTSYWFDSGNAISRAADANISHAVAFEEKIEAEDAAEGVVVVNSTRLFVTEALNRLTELPNPERKPHEVFNIGKLNAGKSKIRDVRNYPQNTDVVVEYVFENEQPYVRGGDEVTDPRYVSLLVQHSLIAAPDASAFAPRHDDPRVGFFTGEVTDLSSTDVTPWRDVISRWKLEKKDPSAAVSEPVEPIVYWIENTTPMELRPIIEAAALRWNEAFESAGFRNAIAVRTQPDDADWDAGDLRYNVIRWTSSPSPPFGGYGPSFFDPRTGQILGADIMLEYAVVGRNVRDARLFGSEAAAADEVPDDPTRCNAALLAHRELLFASAGLDAFGADTEEQQRLLEEFLHFLVLHEIGHTLGLNHNFRSSHLHSLESIADPDATYAAGLTGSVMDYPTVPFAMPGERQPQFWTTRPGPYDHWAITFGYSPAAPDPAREAERLEALLARSTEPQLAFGNDADDMRAPGKAIDPRAMINDMTSDAIGFSAGQMAVVNAVVPRFADRLARDGESYQELLNGFFTAVGRYVQAARVASRYVGGVYVDRAMVGQPGAGAPLTPVSLADQKRAMDLLRERIFAPDAFATLTISADRLLAQRRGFDHFAYTEDPKLHDVALTVQKDIFDHLLHPTVLKRLTDARVYGNEYSTAQMLADLTAAVFEDDLGGDVSTFRQNLQLEYVARLINIVQTDRARYDHVAQTAALDRLRWIERELARSRGGDAETAAHRAHIRYRIERGLDVPRA